MLRKMSLSHAKEGGFSGARGSEPRLGLSWGWGGEQHCRSHGPRPPSTLVPVCRGLHPGLGNLGHASGTETPQ